MNTAKSHESAVVIVPPERLWGPIQAIRQEHDRHVRRWMPHITLIYPFRPRSVFDSAAPALARVCASVASFQIKLAKFRCFQHGRERYTLWLAPEPAQSVVSLQERLWRTVPDCDDVRRMPGGFTPHLSVGQIQGRAQMRALVNRLQAQWEPLAFEVNAVSLIWREAPPRDVFRVDRLITLGSRGGGR